MDGGSRKGQEKWNIISETGIRRYLVLFAKYSRVRDGEAWRFLDPTGIPANVWYRTTLWINLETKPPIVSSRLDLAQDREGCRCHDRISMPMYEKMLIIRNML